MHSTRGPYWATGKKVKSQGAPSRLSRVGERRCSRTRASSPSRLSRSRARPAGAQHIQAHVGEPPAWKASSRHTRGDRPLKVSSSHLSAWASSGARRAGAPAPPGSGRRGPASPGRGGGGRTCRVAGSADWRFRSPGWTPPAACSPGSGRTRPAGSGWTGGRWPPAPACAPPGPPNSLRASKVKVTTRSSGGCSTASSRAPDRCLRRSMQNMGGVSGSPGNLGELGPGVVGVGRQQQAHVPMAGGAHRQQDLVPAGLIDLINFSAVTVWSVRGPGRTGRGRLTAWDHLNRNAECRMQECRMV